MSQTRTDRPWWTYVVDSGSELLGRVLTTRIIYGSGDGFKSAAGVKVAAEDALDPGIEPDMITSTTVIGQTVSGSDGKKLGRVEEVAMDLTTGVISYLVLGTGGFLGFGGKFYSVPLSSLTMKPQERSFCLNMDKKALKQMPEIDKHHWPKRAQWTIPMAGQSDLHKSSR